MILSTWNGGTVAKLFFELARPSCRCLSYPFGSSSGLSSERVGRACRATRPRNRHRGGDRQTRASRDPTRLSAFDNAPTSCCRVDRDPRVRSRPRHQFARFLSLLLLLLLLPPPIPPAEQRASLMMKSGREKTRDARRVALRAETDYNGERAAAWFRCRAKRTMSTFEGEGEGGRDGGSPWLGGGGKAVFRRAAHAKYVPNKEKLTGIYRKKRQRASL